MSRDTTRTRIGLPGGVLTSGTRTSSPVFTSVSSSSDTSSASFSDKGPTSTASSTLLQTLESASTTTVVLFSPLSTTGAEVQARSNVPVIVGVVIGVLGLLSLISTAFFIYFQRRRRRYGEGNRSSEEGRYPRVAQTRESSPVVYGDRWHRGSQGITLSSQYPETAYGIKHEDSGWRGNIEFVGTRVANADVPPSYTPT